MKDRILNALRFCRDVLLADLGIFFVIAASFLFTGGFTFQTYSDRLLWAGIVAVLVGGAGGIFGGLAASVPGAAPRAHTSVQGLDSSERATNGRYGEAAHHKFAFRLWAIGLVCIAASVLVSRLLAR